MSRDPLERLGLGGHTKRRAPRNQLVRQFDPNQEDVTFEVPAADLALDLEAWWRVALRSAPRFVEA